MNTIMNDHHIDTLDKARLLLQGTDEIDLAIDGKRNRYDFIKRTLMRFKYSKLGRADKGLVLRYITRISGYSYVQVKRLAASYLKHGRIQWRHRATRGFARRYSNQDIKLLADMDELHGTLSGHATRKLCERALLSMSKLSMPTWHLSRFLIYTIYADLNPTRTIAVTLKDTF